VLRSGNTLGAAGGHAVTGGGTMAPPTGALGGGAAASGAAGPPSSASAGTSGAEDSPSVSGFGWFDTPYQTNGQKSGRKTSEHFLGTGDTSASGRAGGHSSRAAAVGAAGAAAAAAAIAAASDDDPYGMADVAAAAAATYNEKAAASAAVGGAAAVGGVPRMADGAGRVAAELPGLASPPHKGGAASIPGRLSSIFRRAATGNDAVGGAVANAYANANNPLSKGGEPREPAASRPVGGADDVLEMMRQQEQSNADVYLQAELVMAQAAAADRSKAAGFPSPGAGGGEDRRGRGGGGGAEAWAADRDGVGAQQQRKGNGADDAAIGALAGLSGGSPVMPPKFSPSQYLMEIR
jgi:hypothetical protein